MNAEQRKYLEQWSAKYRTDFQSNIMPFWIQNGMDKVHGGLYTCLDRDGTIIDRTKSVWFQGRFAFVCAYGYNQVAKNAEWLAASKNCIDFIEKHCFDEDGHMFFEICANGEPIRKRR